MVNIYNVKWRWMMGNFLKCVQPITRDFGLSLLIDQAEIFVALHIGISAYQEYDYNRFQLRRKETKIEKKLFCYTLQESQNI